MDDQLNGKSISDAVTLSAEDAAALDAVMALRAEPAARISGDESGKSDPAAPVDAARTARVQGWLNVLGTAPAPRPHADLLKRTLAAVDNERMILQPAASARPSVPASHANEKTPRRRWTYLREVAAMFVAATLLVAVVIPAVGQARQSYRRTLCATNMATLGTAFATYSASYNHELPSLAASQDGNWLNPSATGHTNTDNLMPLINAGYIKPANLICAGQNLPAGTTVQPTQTDIQNCGYSYTNLFGKTKATWNGNPATIILADRNPVFAKKDFSAANINSLNSFNHAQKGTYLLRADGHVTWETAPNIGPANDNIWTIATGTGTGSEQLLHYTGTETPASLHDVFLAP